MSVFGDFMIQGVVKAEAEANELRVQLDAWHTSFGTTQLTHALAERDTLITALRECVVALEGVVGCFDPSEVEEFRTSHEGRSGGEICMGDVVRCWDSVNRAKSTLERYKHEHP